MILLNPLWLAYGAGLALIAAIGGIIILCGGRGKAPRAFFAAAGAGCAVFWMTLAIYLLVVPVPVAPSHRDHDPGDLLVMLYNLWNLLFVGAANSFSYWFGLYFQPVIYGTLSIPVAFGGSFFLPHQPSLQACSKTPAG